MPAVCGPAACVPEEGSITAPWLKLGTKGDSKNCAPALVVAASTLRAREDLGGCLAEQLQQRGAVALELLCADPGNRRERIEIARPGGGDRRERGVVEHHVGRHRLGARLLGAPGLEADEQGVIALCFFP